MAKKLKAGDIIRGYLITKVFGPGMMAISYGAQKAGRKVFLKQYKSPAPSVIWYDAFIEYQRELSGRVRAGNAVHFAVAQVDAFEEMWGGPCYFQVYEFVENGADLQQILDKEREQHRVTRAPPTNEHSVWARHVTWAKVLTTAIAALHESKIVHADLKPANAYLVQDSTIASGYQLKLIDMDFSLLADRRAPWHGHQAYVGTDNYRSPEHVTRGSVPGLPSDVFTCGLMLYELLAGLHPYWRDDQREYAKLVRAHAASPPALLGLLPAPSSNAEVSSALHRSLDPDPTARPTAAELRAILSGRGAKLLPPSASSPTRTRSQGTPSELSSGASSEGNVIVSDGIELKGPNGRSLRISVRTELGKALVRQLGPDGEFWDDRQCILECSSQRRWIVSPVAGSTNETLVNGSAIITPHTLRQGDLIAVGREARGISKLPLTVRGL